MSDEDAYAEMVNIINRQSNNKSNNKLNNIFDNSLFYKASEYVFTERLSKPYKDALIDKDGKFQEGICKSLTDNISLTDKNNIRTERPNNGIAHATRMCGWIYIYALYFKQMKEYNDILNNDTLLRICITGLFLHSGKESEAYEGVHNITSCKEKLGKEDDEYDFLTEYTNNAMSSLEAYANTDDGKIVYGDSVKDYSDLIKNYFSYSRQENKDFRKLMGTLLNNANNVDLVRASNNLSLTDDQLLGNSDQKDVIKLACLMCNIMGDTIHKQEDIQDYEETKKPTDLLVKYNNSPAECIKVLKRILDKI
jgi:hypothetical protein